MKTIKNLLPILILLVAVNVVYAAPLSSHSDRINLARGHKVLYSPSPDYSITNKGDTNGTDLTDEKTTKRNDQEIWRDSGAVGWTYRGQFNLATDLEKQCAIDEVAIRLVGGSAQIGITIPGIIKVMVSNDGKHYRKVDEFSRFNKNDFKKFNVPKAQGKAWVYKLRFKNLNVTGRYVGLQMYSSSLTVSDELYIYGHPLDNIQIKENFNNNIKSKFTGFTVNHAELYFHKPYLKLATNLALPVPIGMTTPDSKKMNDKETIILDIPKGVELVKGKLGSTKVTEAETKSLSNGGKAYQFIVKKPYTHKLVGRLYIRASDWEDGQKGILRI